MLTAAAAYLNVSRNMSRTLDGVARSQVVARETGYYLEHIGSVKTIDDLVSNKRLMRYALNAFGLADVANSGALIRRILEGGVDKPDALANRLVDQRYRDFVSTFNFVRYGPATTAFDRATKGTVEGYQREVLEENAGALNEGARLALYFARKAPNVASPLGLLADKALLSVTQTALGIAPSTSNLSIDAQVKIIAGKLNVADLKDKSKLDHFLTTFLARWDLNNPVAAASSPIASAIGITSVAIGSDLLLAIQKIYRSG